MIRLYARLASVAALVVLSLSISKASAQQQVPAVPAAPSATAAESSAAAAAPSAPAPAPEVVFPKTSPEFFTAASPTKDVIDSFFKTSWGYDPNRVWQIQAILKTPVEGVSKVVVLVGDKSGKQKIAAVQFFVLPDGKHIIAGDEILPFGAHPYADNRALLEQKADGPYRGPAAKDLELVEFADFECPHCKAAQANMDRLLVDFPKAHIVFQNYPLARIHPEAVAAAQYGVCVNKLGGSAAFFQFAQAVFDGQQGLVTKDGATLTLNSAVTKAGLDPVKVAACASTPETATEVENSVKLAQDLNVLETPTLMVNGRQVPIGGLPYDTLKKIIEYQAQLDGVAAQ